MDNIIETTSVIPRAFDGVFRFTNFTDREFITEWNNKEYVFPANSTVPLIIPDESSLNIQNIRKAFAKRLAIREFYSGSEYARLNAMTSNGVPPTFNEKQLEPLIERCLEPLPITSIEVHELPTDSEENYSESVDVLNEKDDLVAKAKNAEGAVKRKK